MERHEIESWLGPAINEVTDEQVDQLAAVAAEIDERYPDPDDADDRDAALTVAFRLVVERAEAEDVVADLAHDLLHARLAELRALAGIQQAARVLVRVDRSARGLESQQGFALAAGVDRSAVRTWLGL